MSQGIRTKPPLPDENVALYGLKRRIYLALLPLVAVVGLVSWAITDFGRDEDLVGKLIVSGFSLWMALLTVLLLLSRRSFRWVELGMYWGAVGLFVVNLYRNLGQLNETGIWQPDLWMGIMFLAAHFIFAPRAALQVSIALFVAYGLVGLWVLVPQAMAGKTLDQITILHIYASQLGYLLMTRLLVGIKEHLAQTRLEATRFYQMAHTDPLTGVDNRRSLMDMLKAALERKSSHEPVSLILLDLDNFKQINDRYGHEIGDRVLVHVASLLQQNLRQADQVGRWGGEEFVLLLPNTVQGEAQGLAERMQRVLMENPLENLRPISASFGVATAVLGDTPDTLVSKADTAMYASKQAGGNRVEIA